MTKRGGVVEENLDMYYKVSQLCNVVTYLMQSRDSGLFETENASVAPFFVGRNLLVTT